jgi:hypothetical protein
LCRFSDAGSDEPSTRSGGRHLKSAKARNRGGVGHRRCRGLYGDLAAASGFGRGGIKAPAPIALPRGLGVGDGLNVRSKRCWTGLAVRLRTDLLTCSKRGLCWPRASHSASRSGRANNSCAVITEPPKMHTISFSAMRSDAKIPLPEGHSRISHLGLSQELRAEIFKSAAAGRRFGACALHAS